MLPRYSRYLADPPSHGTSGEMSQHKTSIRETAPTTRCGALPELLSRGLAVPEENICTSTEAIKEVLEPSWFYPTALSAHSRAQDNLLCHIRDQSPSFTPRITAFLPVCFSPGEEGLNTSLHKGGWIQGSHLQGGTGEHSCTSAMSHYAPQAKTHTTQYGCCSTWCLTNSKRNFFVVTQKHKIVTF